jgi:hypothetical protein
MQAALKSGKEQVQTQEQRPCEQGSGPVGSRCSFRCGTTFPSLVYTDHGREGGEKQEAGARTAGRREGAGGPARAESAPARTPLT